MQKTFQSDKLMVHLIVHLIDMKLFILYKSLQQTQLSFEWY
jgi:hypothetical protein